MLLRAWASVYVMFTFWVLFIAFFKGQIYPRFFIYMAAILLIVIFGRLLMRLGFKKLKIHRIPDEYAIPEDEAFKITTIIENRKRLPLPFVNINEVFTTDMWAKPLQFSHQYRIGKYERLTKVNMYKPPRRGVYLIRKIDVVIGDAFGLFEARQSFDDLMELVAYPKIIPLEDFNFESSSIQGPQVVKRWIYEDPLFIKGIREYSVDDRMKDIHWKSSLKLNKLMVKNYDHTAEKKLGILMNVDCGNTLLKPDEDAIELGIRIAATLTQECLATSTAVGIWTNAQIFSYYRNTKKEVPFCHSLKEVLNLCGRIGYFHRRRFAAYLKGIIPRLDKNSTYIVITPYLDEEDVTMLLKMRKIGFILHIIDVSTDGTVPLIPGIQTVHCSLRRK